MILTQEEVELLQRLGLNLRKARIRKGETQADLGARAGVSRELIGRMEAGDPGVSLGKLIKTSSALGLLDTWEEVLAIPPDPFEEFDKKQLEQEQLKKARVKHKYIKR